MIRNRSVTRQTSLCKLILFTIGLIPFVVYCSIPPSTAIPIIQSENPTLVSGFWTPLPTYLPDDRREIVMNLYENPTCELPCWWGITPGKTEWRDAWQFLVRFAANQAPYDTHFFESENLPGYQFFQVFLDVPELPDQEYYATLNHLVFFMQQSSSIVEYIDVNTGNVGSYTISKILATYGPPQQVYVHARPHQRLESNSVSLYLYYPDRGFMSVHFTTVDQDVWKKKEFTACFQKYTRLLLWTEGQHLDSSIVRGLGLSDVLDSGQDPYQSIEDVSKMNTKDFFQAFIDSSEQVCIRLITENLNK